MLNVTDKQLVVKAVLAAGAGPNYDFYDSSARLWLADWGSYHWKWRDRDELGYPQVTSFLYSGGGVGRADLPDMTPGAELVDKLYEHWTEERRAIAWVCWVDHAGCSKQYQCDRLKGEYKVVIDRNRLTREINSIISAVTTAVILNDV